jgi:hypothetical protein
MCSGIADGAYLARRQWHPALTVTTARGTLLTRQNSFLHGTRWDLQIVPIDTVPDAMYCIVIATLPLSFRMPPGSSLLRLAVLAYADD